MIFMKRIFLMICVGLIALTLNAQEENGKKLDLSVDVASGFLYRGLVLNSTPVFQPTVTFTSGNFLLGAWASTAFADVGEFRGLDIFAVYQLLPTFSVGLTNYFPHGWGDISYFNYKKEETGHAYDLQLMYEGLGGFKALGSVIIGGDDLMWKDGELKRNFSTYLELGYGGTTASGLDWELFAGVVMMKSGFYAIDGAGFTNIGAGVTKSFEITPTYSLPLSMKFSINPAYESVFLTASVALF